MMKPKSSTKQTRSLKGKVKASQKKKAKVPAVKSTRPYPFAFGPDPIRCSLCHKLYADIGSYNDHIICCMKEYPEAAALMHGRFPQGEPVYTNLSEVRKAAEA